MTYRDPKTKEEILDRMTRIDFSGDLRDLGKEVKLVRLKRHILQLVFPETGKKFNLTVHKPRPENSAKKAAKPKARAAPPRGKKKQPTPDVHTEH